MVSHLIVTHLSHDLQARKSFVSFVWSDDPSKRLGLEVPYATALAALDAPSRLPDVEQRGGWIYNFWKDEAHPRGIYRRATLEEFRKPEPAWETVLDIDSLAQQENTPWVFHGMDCLPPEYRKCLVSLSPGGGDAEEVREFDTEALAFVFDGFFVPTAKTGIAWRDADSVFLGTDFGPGSMTESGYPRQVRLWTRGTPRARAPVLFETKPKSVSAYGLRLRSDDGDVDLIVDNRTFWENDYYQLLPDGSLHPLELPATARIDDLYRGRLIISLKDDWQRGERLLKRDSVLLVHPSVLRATGEGARGGSLDVLAESSGSEVVLGATAAKSGILVSVLDNVRGRLYRYEEAESGWTRRQIALPDNGSLAIGSVDGTSGDAFVTFEDFVTPPTLYYVADANPVPEAVKQQAPTFDGSRFEVSQHWAVSTDGTRVPYFQVAPKGMVLDGTRPTHIFSYGGFRAALVPSYSGSYEQLYGAYGKTWLERGGVFVLANIRGGGEYGKAWHDAGRLQNKTGLMDELGKVKRVIEKLAEVDEVLLVLDATTGQNGLNQARVFAEVVNITGIVLTKLDGTAKGGIVVAIQKSLGVPVKPIGLGEGADDLAPFDAENFVDAILN